MDSVKLRKVKVLKKGLVRGDSVAGQELEIKLSDADLERLLTAGACEDLAKAKPVKLEPDETTKPKK